jgi:hypothetical protein
MTGIYLKPNPHRIHLPTSELENGGKSIPVGNTVIGVSQTYAGCAILGVDQDRFA